MNSMEMSNNLSEISTNELMKVADYKSNPNKDSAYNATEILFKRWRCGVDTEFLVGLLESEKTYERLRGAYYLGELGGAVEGLLSSAVKLADDPLSSCRRAFVGYMITSQAYDEAIARGLAKCLLDFHLPVRLAVIKWAVGTAGKRLEKFSQLVEVRAGAVEPSFRNPLSDEFWSESSRKRAIC
ncbi:hypothetical protein CHELA1G11_21231 [Hyphomicrobiales bacterium]|nr:hypothetical protein CHELA1G11_21231 [Hyphomicrobiales bacterium]CAH1693843.1 hypothetical protein CHELA1G2_21537 [Hyphomicrobiales bacterium]